MNLLDFIFPKRCVSCSQVGAYICRGCFSKIEFVDAPVCPACQRQAIGGRVHPGCAKRYGLDGLVVACGYRDPIKVAIKKVKYKWVYDIESILVDLLALRIWKFDLAQSVILVPVPLHKKRKNWRGFNQAEILAKTLSRKFATNYAEILIRNRETKTQVGLSRDDRKKNVRDAFSLAGGVSIGGEDLVLVDDVYTSGATMAECAKVLKRSGAKSVWGIAVALG